MKNLFAAYKYSIEGETKQKKDARYFLKLSFLDLYENLNQGRSNLLKIYLLQLQGKISMLYLLKIITEEEYLKLLHYTTLFAIKYNLI